MTYGTYGLFFILHHQPPCKLRPLCGHSFISQWLLAATALSITSYSHKILSSSSLIFRCWAHYVYTTSPIRNRRLAVRFIFLRHPAVLPTVFGIPLQTISFLGVLPQTFIFHGVLLLTMGMLGVPSQIFGFIGILMHRATLGVSPTTRPTSFSALRQSFHRQSPATMLHLAPVQSYSALIRL